MAKTSVALWSRKILAKDTAEPHCKAGQQLAACRPAERPIELVSQERPAASSVGQRKAFFEAMIRSNSDTFVSVSPCLFKCLLSPFYAFVKLLLAQYCSAYIDLTKFLLL